MVDRELLLQITTKKELYGIYKVIVGLELRFTVQLGYNFTVQITTLDP